MCRQQAEQAASMPPLPSCFHLRRSPRPLPAATCNVSINLAATLCRTFSPPLLPLFWMFVSNGNVLKRWSFSSFDTKSRQVSTWSFFASLGCCTCRCFLVFFVFFGVRFGEGEGSGPSISVSGVIMQKFHTGTLHEEEGGEVGGAGFPKSNKGLCLAQVWEAAAPR